MLIWQTAVHADCQELCNFSMILTNDNIQLHLQLNKHNAKRRNYNAKHQSTMQKFVKFKNSKTTSLYDL